MKKLFFTRSLMLLAAGILTAGTTASAQWMGATGGIWYNLRVGIGTSTPLNQLHIHEGVIPAPSHAFRISQADGSSCIATAEMSFEHPAIRPRLSNVSTKGDFVIRTVIDDVLEDAGECARDIVVSTQTPTGAIRFATWDGATSPNLDAERMTIHQNGRVGIGTGTSAPEGQLHIRANEALVLEATDPSSHAAPWLTFKEQGDPDFWAIMKRGGAYGPEADRLHFAFKEIIGSSEMWYPNMELFPEGQAHFYGQVGIGTQPPIAVPGVRLHVDGGSVVIGTNHQVVGGRDDYKLAVDGLLVAKEVYVTASNWAWPDFVFEENYDLPSLEHIEAKVRSDKHLPGIPSAAEVQKNGVNMGELQMKLLQKVEELTLYVIDQQKQIKTLQSQLDAK